MNIYLKEISIDDGIEYFNLINELSSYDDVYAKPMPEEMPIEDWENYKKIRCKMKYFDEAKPNRIPTTTFWVMDGDEPIGFMTLRQKADLEHPGGHYGLCLKKAAQGKGIGTIASHLLDEVAYNDYGIEEVIYTSKKENVNSQKSVGHIGAEFVHEANGYLFYKDDLSKKFGQKK